MGLPKIVVLVLILVGVAVVVRTVRRVRLLRRGGVDVSLRRGADLPGRRRWRHGVARYRGDQLHWYRVASLRSGPDVVVNRTELEILDRRSATDAEAYAVPAHATILRCRGSVGSWELAMDDDVLPGFSSWLESTPPGRSTGYRQAS